MSSFNEEKVYNKPFHCISKIFRVESIEKRIYARVTVSQPEKTKNIYKIKR
jgi:hypothetical protein